VAHYLETSPLSRDRAENSKTPETEKSILEPAMEMFLQQKQEIEEKISLKP